MGLSVSHNCWTGSYSSFNRWRIAICAAADWGLLTNYQGYWGDEQDERAAKPFPPATVDVLTVLLSHSDCDGSIGNRDCAPLADRLEGLLPKLEKFNENESHFYNDTVQFIHGLRNAAQAEEDVKFR